MNRRCWQAVVGLELHAQLKSSRKLFSRMRHRLGADLAQERPQITLRLPMRSFQSLTLPFPMLNRECVEMAARAALALQARVHQHSAFDRKHYFYHDLPAGYQITQKYQPLATGGVLTLGSAEGLQEPRQIRLEQIQLEQDTAKSLVMGDESADILVDLNRAGTALMELVTAPDLRSGAEAVAFVKKIAGILRAVGASDAIMDDGTLRVDVNVSVNKPGEPFGVRCELKNLASFRSIQHAIEAEVERQIGLLESDPKALASSTRAYDPDGQRTVFLRNKDTSTDYRYMPDPELPLLYLSPETIQHLQNTLPPLPEAVRERLERQYELSPSLASILVDQEIVGFFEETAQKSQPASGKTVANWIVNTLFGELAERNLAVADCGPQRGVTTDQLGSLICAVQQGRVMQHEGKSFLHKFMDARPDAPLIDHFLSAQDQFVARTQLEQFVRELALENAKGLSQLKAVKAKPAVMTWFAGQTMRRAKGRAQPEVLRAALQSVLVGEHGVSASVFDAWAKGDASKKPKQ